MIRTRRIPQAETLPQYRMLRYLERAEILSQPWVQVELLDDTHIRIRDGAGYYSVIGYFGPDDIRETDCA